MLEIHYRASNLATVGELGRFPIYNPICESISKLYLHVKGKEPDSLLQQTLQTSKQLHKNGIRSWYSGMDTILNELKLDEGNISSVKLHLNSFRRGSRKFSLLKWQKLIIWRYQGWGGGGGSGPPAPPPPLDPPMSLYKNTWSKSTE